MSVNKLRFYSSTVDPYRLITTDIFNFNISRIILPSLTGLDYTLVLGSSVLVQISMFDIPSNVKTILFDLVITLSLLMNSYYAIRVLIYNLDGSVYLDGCVLRDSVNYDVYSSVVTFTVSDLLSVYILFLKTLKIKVRAKSAGQNNTQFLLIVTGTLPLDIHRLQYDFPALKTFLIQSVFNFLVQNIPNDQLLSGINFQTQSITSILVPQQNKISYYRISTIAGYPNYTVYYSNYFDTLANTMYLFTLFIYLDLLLPGYIIFIPTVTTFNEDGTIYNNIMQVLYNALRYYFLQQPADGTLYYILAYRTNEIGFQLVLTETINSIYALYGVLLTFNVTSQFLPLINFDLQTNAANVHVQLSNLYQGNGLQSLFVAHFNFSGSFTFRKIKLQSLLDDQLYDIALMFKLIMILTDNTLTIGNTSNTITVYDKHNDISNYIYLIPLLYVSAKVKGLSLSVAKPNLSIFAPYGLLTGLYGLFLDIVLSYYKNIIKEYYAILVDINIPMFTTLRLGDNVLYNGVIYRIFGLDTSNGLYVIKLYGARYNIF